MYNPSPMSNAEKHQIITCTRATWFNFFFNYFKILNTTVFVTVTKEEIDCVQGPDALSTTLQILFHSNSPFS